MRIKLPAFFLILVVLSIFGSCNRNVDKIINPSKEYVSLDGQVLIGGIIYSAKELSLQSLLKKQDFSSTKMDSIKNVHQLERIYAIQFRTLIEEDILNRSYTGISYSEGVQYLSSDISSDFSVIINRCDTINSSGVLFERSFNITPHKRLLVYFDAIPSTAEVDILYNDQLFGNGTIRFDNQKIKL